MRILIVDDAASVRGAVRTVMEGYQGFEVIGEARNGEDAIEQTAMLKPNLVIMDLCMPFLDGFGAAEIIKLNSPKTRILILSLHALPELIQNARNLGLDGFVSKEDNGLSLRLAVDALIRDETYFPV